MSFISILRTVFTDGLKVAGVASSVATVVTPFIAPVMSPAALAVEQRISGWINTAETMMTTANSGVAKKESVQQIIASELPQIPEIIALVGGNVAYDEAALSATIDAAVAFKNSLATLMASIKKK